VFISSYPVVPPGECNRSAEQQQRFPLFVIARSAPWQAIDMARVVRFHQIDGPEVLRIEEVEVAPPGKGEVQISIKVLGLNRAESMFRSAQYLENPNLPARLEYEAAGTVAAIGSGVQGFKVSDAVSTIPSFSLNDFGLYG
jgi:NADPH:quinone reductase-like Zn-dependent oxidoreductase